MNADAGSGRLAGGEAVERELEAALRRGIPINAVIGHDARRRRPRPRRFAVKIDKKSIFNILLIDRPGTGPEDARPRVVRCRETF